MTAERHAVGAIVLDGSGRILLVRRANAPAQGLWSIPGGRVEGGETSEVAVIRELREETGLVGVVIREVGTIRLAAADGGTYLVRDFLVSTDGAPDPVAGDDAADAAWIVIDDLAQVDTSPGLVDALVAWNVIGS